MSFGAARDRRLKGRKVFHDLRSILHMLELTNAACTSNGNDYRDLLLAHYMQLFSNKALVGSGRNRPTAGNRLQRQEDHL
jgi:hypothetical protein